MTGKALQMERCVVMGDDYFWNGDPTPRTEMGACKECGQHWSTGHLGTCSFSLMRSGIPSEVLHVSAQTAGSMTVTRGPGPANTPTFR